MGHKKQRAKVAALADPIPGLISTGYLKDVAESSGLALGPEPGTFYTHGDHGNAPVLSVINWQGELLRQVEIPTATNEDWEALTVDDTGRIYIGDFGNNKNNRRDLTIYRFDPAQPAAVPPRIRFRYADQTAFPPPDPADHNWDCEAMVWRDGQLYLFSRDRGRSRTCRIHRLPDTPTPPDEEAVAEYIGSYELPAQVTDAALHPDGHLLALLSQQQLFLVKITPESLLDGEVRIVPLPEVSHAEGVVFTDSVTLAITTEKGGMYQLILSASEQGLTADTEIDKASEKVSSEST
jgi:hypothetical protein